jgi:hypothetical protein
MKIRPVGADVPCGQTDRQTHMTKLIVAFCSFENAPKTLKDKPGTRSTEVPDLCFHFMVFRRFERKYRLHVQGLVHPRIYPIHPRTPEF